MDEQSTLFSKQLVHVSSSGLPRNLLESRIMSILNLICPSLCVTNA
jgi:hypothetical protein